MKVVDRYLAGGFFRIFVLAFSAFIGLFLLVEFFEKLRFLFKYHPPLADALLLFAAKVPWMAVQVVPMAALLATLVSLVLLSRHAEVVAFRCTGLSLTRLARPYLACGLALSVAVGLAREFVAPRSLAFYHEVKHVRIQKRPARTLVRSDDLWLRSGTTIVHVDRLEPDGLELEGISVLEVAGSRVTRRVDAATGRWDGTRWQLENVEERVFDPEGLFTTRTYPKFTLPPGDARPEDLRIERDDPEELSWAEVRDRIRNHRRRGFDTRDLEVALWSKTSLPFACLIMPLLAFPFGIRTVRHGGTALGIVWAVALGFTYWLGVGFAMSLGKTGALPPWAAAWLPNTLFAVIGVALIRRAERGG